MNGKALQQMAVRRISKKRVPVTAKLAAMRVRRLMPRRLMPRRLQRGLSPEEVFAELKRDVASSVDYSRDDYPRTDCRVVIELGATKYSWGVYSPGPQARLLEWYAPRPMASIGVALAAFANGETVCSVLSEMYRAERQASEDQSGDSGPSATPGMPDEDLSYTVRLGISKPYDGIIEINSVATNTLLKLPVGDLRLLIDGLEILDRPDTSLGTLYLDLSS